MIQLGGRGGRGEKGRKLLSRRGAFFFKDKELGTNKSLFPTTTTGKEGTFQFFYSLGSSLKGPNIHWDTQYFIDGMLNVAED
jgi:hypothetical protein